MRLTFSQPTARRKERGALPAQSKDWCRLGDLNTRPHHYETHLGPFQSFPKHSKQRQNACKYWHSYTLRFLSVRLSL